ncbi:MAG: hypothetical protein PWR03_537 [Tenuifilum sp.]|uniref:hypothetical protein n=1 Tax=Tenuifilum sp. TaxID=2760880 RepID=UPI0024AB900F|nr:hypothetical protein [Tenuifilum sp.]MDI3526354.1 hypothetical protein [Tenuifilum sp.]
MIELLRNKKIIINTDIDGVISGLLLTNYLDCEVVGFSNSSDKVWLDPDKCKNIFDAVYVDMFVANEDTISIDQHIIAVNNFHYELIIKNKNKINPNLFNPRFFIPSDSYKKKYPFGTCHFIISLLCKIGINLSNLNLDTNNSKLSFIDYLLRADDTMNTSLIKYTKNAQDWWKWMIDFSNKSYIIYQIVNYLYSTNKVRANEIKQEISQMLITLFNCDRSDGGINQITNENGTLKSMVIDYINFISNISNLTCFDYNLKLKEIKGINKRIRITENQQNELIFNNTINGELVFSYAFVKTQNYSECFSYTVFQNYEKNRTS